MHLFKGWICLTKCIERRFIKNLHIPVYCIFVKIKMFLEKPCRVELRDNHIVCSFEKKYHKQIKQYNAVKVKQCCNVKINLR